MADFIRQCAYLITPSIENPKTPMLEPCAEATQEIIGISPDVVLIDEITSAKSVEDTH
jgi:hypothetical protein